MFIVHQVGELVSKTPPVRNAYGQQLVDHQMLLWFILMFILQLMQG